MRLDKDKAIPDEWRTSISGCDENNLLDVWVHYYNGVAFYTYLLMLEAQSR